MSFLRDFVLTLTVLCAVVALVFTPIWEVPYEVTEEAIVEFKYHEERAPSYIIPSTAPDINVTNDDSINGSFSIVMIWTPNEINPKYPVVGRTHTETKTIPPNSTYTFQIPDEWAFTGPTYSFSYRIEAPKRQANVTRTKTECKSVFQLITG
jgi:hypothetical protein